MCVSCTALYTGYRGAFANSLQITNRRCQEWTMEYVRELVRTSYIGSEAIAAVNSQRDPPTHGIGLQPVKRGDEKTPD